MDTASELMACSTATQPMDESLEFIFSSMMQQGEVSEAVDFIASIEYNFIPSKTVMRSLIFQVLMRSDDVRSLSKTSIYLTNIVKVYPPINEERRLFFYDSVREEHGFLSDLWSVFCHIVNSYFCYHRIYHVSEEDSGSTAIKYPNCKFLFNFYMGLFSIDFEHLYFERSRDGFEEERNFLKDCNHVSLSISGLSTNTFSVQIKTSFKGCLLMHLFWPSGDTNTSNRTEYLYKWINDIYGIPSVNQWPDLLQNLHEILTLTVKCIIQGKYNLKEVAAFNHPSLADIAEDITNFCKNAFNSLSNVKLFLSFITLPCLRARVSEKIIRLIFKQSTKSFSILTLKEIVHHYMFPQKFNKWKTPKPPVNIDKKLRKRGEKQSEVPKKMERTILHDLCEENKFADLMLTLRTTSEHINTRDHSGCTPLHIACTAGSYMCVKILINESGMAEAPKLDFTVANCEGQTPLHITVRRNYLEIARLLLNSGGSDLLNSLDNKSQVPGDLSTSADMKKLLEEYKPAPATAASELEAFVEDSHMKEAPPLKSFKEFSIYLHALSCLLSSYTDLTQLYNLVWKKTNVVQKHADKKCCHYENDDIACSEDATLLAEMPDLIDVFIQSVQKNVSKLNINIDIELIPLKGYKASIQAKPRNL